ncbi:alpha-L-fucosidase [Paenibacillus oceani]|uniref:alpha-L-fucosidase n=1 Tax=Paenibacillus oceani TaxID=2772510 RepID=A0A927GZW7_9BACL|nr:alpha-L-fucosidase [Paenibacillus oceani]MBD2862683.1 alpha-L-fucosidase [Paenibacillus oceani]
MQLDPKAQSRSWFQQSRFGMFIHWGLYAITGRDMWYYAHEEVDKAHYERLFRRFNPTDYDPAAWARLAKRAGMKYAVLTTKHHDGFCLWDSKHTDFKVTNTPYGKDLLRPWIEAFRAEGLKIGIYYSLIDWHHPHFTVDFLHPQRKQAEHLNKTRDFAEYRQYLHDQVRELMTEYGRIDIFWPDYSYGPLNGSPGKQAADWDSPALKAMIEELQPGILMNNRLGVPGEMECDFLTPEQYIPTKDVSKQSVDSNRAPMWEACETIGASWGYYRGDAAIKSTKTLIRHLVTCVGNNGNLLLNVGPTPRGRIESEFAERLEEIGQWLELYGESIYGAGSSPYRIFRKICPDLNPVFTQKQNEVFIHFFDEYPAFDVIVGELGGKVDYVEFVGDRTEIGFEDIELDGRAHLRLKLPIIRPDPYDTVIRIMLKPTEN